MESPINSVGPQKTWFLKQIFQELKKNGNSSIPKKTDTSMYSEKKVELWRQNIQAVPF